MTSFYSVVRFVPSSLAEEFINIGVLTYGDGVVRSKFVDDWGRVELFAQSDRLANAKAFQEWVEESILPEGPSDRRIKKIDEVTVRQIATEWQGSIQVTQPRASLLDPDVLLDDVAPTFLIEPISAPPEILTRQPHAEDKRRLVSGLRDALAGAVSQHIQKDQHVVVRTRSRVSADMRSRKFDVVVSNGIARCAAQCFNFVVANPDRILEQVDATAFAIQDVRRKLPDLPMAMVLSKASAREDAHEIARKAAAKAGAECVVEDELSGWAEDVIGRVAQSL